MFKFVIIAVLALLQIGNCGFVKSCSQTCKELQQALPNSRVQATAKTGAYFAAQLQSVQGACYVYPETPEEVATVVKTASKYQCEFAIKSGGHSQVYGANNIQGGLILNLDVFNNVALSSDRTYALVGAGNVWNNVYRQLDPLNYTVLGGRVSGVGVGGLTLGGGISYLSGSYGLACDNVLAYEVVLANGTISTITQQNYPDLYRALRGGSGNFAIVTQFHLAAYEYHLFQSGLETYTDSPAVQKETIAALTHFVNHGDESPGADMFASLQWVNNTPLWVNGYSYAKPSPPIPAVSAYQRFYTKTLNDSLIFSSRRTSTQYDFVTEVAKATAVNDREQYYTGTYAVDEQFLNDLFNAYRNIVAKLYTAINGTSELYEASLTVEPLTRNTLRLQSQRGGNVLGLDPNGRPLVIICISTPWKYAKNDALFEGSMNEVIETANALAKERGLFNEYIYLNYASTGSPVMQGYGEANVRFMRDVSAKYDPKGVFQKLVPGPFKLPTSK